MRTQRAGLWLLAMALLATVDFGYAHLQHLAFWPVQLIASSLWRLAEAHGSTADSALPVWAPLAALLLAGSLAGILAVRSRRRPSRQDSEGDRRE